MNPRGTPANLKPFKPGVSGNPGGRPKRNASSEIAQAIFENNEEAIQHLTGRELYRALGGTEPNSPFKGLNRDSSLGPVFLQAPATFHHDQHHTANRARTGLYRGQQATAAPAASEMYGPDDWMATPRSQIFDPHEVRPHTMWSPCNSESVL